VLQLGRRQADIPETRREGTGRDEEGIPEEGSHREDIREAGGPRRRAVEGTVGILVAEGNPEEDNPAEDTMDARLGP